MHLTRKALRRYAIARSLFSPVSLRLAVARLGFVQADPIRAPARAQDLTLRPRVVNYRAFDLDRAYGELGLEEDCLVNYGYLPREHLALMHPRVPRRGWDAATAKRANALLRFARTRPEVHPRDVEARFGSAKVKNYWGGTSNATTHLLDALHYRGHLRVVRREAGVRVYAPRDLAPIETSDAAPEDRANALLWLAAKKYAPLPARSLGQLASMLRYGAPQLAASLKAAATRAKATWPRVTLDGTEWLWPPDEEPLDAGEPETLHLLAPFDPVVWDRRRFELFWGWAYRFEAYTPAKKRVRGYYALPLLWRDDVVGWANLSAGGGQLDVDLGFVSGAAPRGPAFRRALEEEVENMRTFLGLASPSSTPPPSEATRRRAAKAR